MPKPLSRIAERITSEIARLAENFSHLKIMHFCGTHEHTITYHGLRSIIPQNIELIAGPGCPVCILPASIVDEAVRLSMEGVYVLTYGDVYRLPGSEKSLHEARSEGAKVKPVYGFLDAVKISKTSLRNEDVVFLAAGFETTLPTILSQVKLGKVPNNLTILLACRNTVAAMRYILENKVHRLNGIIAPGHVSAIIGASAWSFVATEHGVPVVVAGFEPLDVLIAVLNILSQNIEGKAYLENEYSRVVSWNGNTEAKKLMSELLIVSDGYWRGIGLIPKSAWRFREKYRRYDAIEEYGLDVEKPGIDLKPGCRCAEIVLGMAKPTDCPLFMKSCTPSRPLGPCMVSVEGTCRIWAIYGSGYRA